MRRFWFVLALASAASNALAQSDSQVSDQDLADELSNPISDLTSVPFQFNWDCCYAVSDAGRFTLNTQTVVPFHLNQDWSLIVRTIMPVIGEGGTAPGTSGHVGLGDTLQSFFFSPTPSRGGIIWGVGPAFLWPTATETAFGSQQFGAGPSTVALKQDSHWTMGMLANHIWTYGAGHSSVSRTFLQPFLGYTWPDSTGLTLNSESTYDWHDDQWTVPVNLTLSRLFRFGEQPLSVQVGGRYYPITPQDGPRWGVRLNATLLFPE